MRKAVEIQIFCFFREINEMWPKLFREFNLQYNPLLRKLISQDSLICTLCVNSPHYLSAKIPSNQIVCIHPTTNSFHEIFLCDAVALWRKLITITVWLGKKIVRSTQQKWKIRNLKEKSKFFRQINVFSKRLLNR